MSRSLFRVSALLALFTGVAAWAAAGLAPAEGPGVVYEGTETPGLGKHIVLVAGDEEYRSEEALPMLAKILAVRHGFKCTVLFSVNPKDGTIDPNNQTYIPGLEVLEKADLMLLFLRFRELPDEQMKYIDAFVHSGKPIIGLRTATHSFMYSRNTSSPYAHYDWRHKEWPNGFGRQVLGETWINHHGHHRVESTRGVINEALKDNPILKGVTDIWGPTDVYGIKNLIPEAKVLVYGQVLEGMQPTDKPVAGPKNNPMMPLAWIKDFQGKQGRTSRVFCTTMGASVDFESAGLRRLLVNACYWGLGLEDKIPSLSNVNYVGEYKPTFYGGGNFQKGVKPSDLKL